MGHVMTKQETIDEITRRLVEFYQPVRIYLFGSEARGDAGPDSDFDFLVVVPDATPDSVFRSGEVYGMLRGVGVPVDIVPWRHGDFDGRSAHVRSSLPATVLREGRLVYDSEPVSVG
jgi:predicted nucleotidyltransferase